MKFRDVKTDFVLIMGTAAGQPRGVVFAAWPVSGGPDRIYW